MLLIKQIFFGLLLPALVGGGIFVIARSLSPKAYATVRYEKEQNGFAGWLIAAALGVGYIVGYLGLEGLPAFPPKLGTHWLCYLTIIGLIVGRFWHRAVWGPIAQIASSIIIPRLLLMSTFKHTWSPIEGIIWWVGLAVVIFIIWHLVEQSFSVLPSGASSPFVYFGLSGGTALILALSGSLRLAQHCGILVTLFAASWVLILGLQRDRKPFIFPSGASPVVTLLLIGIWMNGYFFAEVPAMSAILLAISPLLAQVGRIAAVQGLGGWRSTLVQITAVALPVVIAIGIAVIRSGFLGDRLLIHEQTIGAVCLII